MLSTLRHSRQAISAISRSTTTNSVRHFSAAAALQQKQGQPLEKYKVGFFCDGAEQQGSGKVFPSINPATDEVIADVYSCTKEEVNQCVESAKRGFEVWGKKMTGVERGVILNKAADIIEKNKESIALLETRDTGHCLAETLPAHVEQGIATLRYYANCAPNALEGKLIPLESGSFAHSVREPYGVCGAVVAWNYPFNMALYKASILLAAGNSVVMKPSSKTPCNTVGLAELFRQAGMPEGVFNVVQGGGEVGSWLCEHPDVNKVSFTGSTPVGEKILKMCAPTIKPCTLELGGKSPLIVFDDADILPAVKAALIANFYSAGEICTNGTRIFVHDSVYSAFLSEFKVQTEKLKVGCPEDAKTQIGSLIDAKHADSVRDFISQGLESGATLVTGGVGGQESDSLKDLAPHLNPDAFIAPTIFADVEDHHVLAKEEIFGPVASVLRFKEVDEVIARANDTPYGLAAGLFTRNLARAHYVSNRLEAGIVWVNTYNLYAPNVPVGGFKQSGFGREFGAEALDHCTHTKSIYFEMNPDAGNTDF